MLHFFLESLSAKTLQPSLEAQGLRNYSKLKIWQAIHDDIDVNIGINMLTIRKCSKTNHLNFASESNPAE